MTADRETGTTAPAGPVASGLTHLPVAERPLSALILDDLDFDRRRLIVTCRKAGLNLQPTEVGTLADFTAALDRRRFDLVFLDYRLAGEPGDGLTALDQALERQGRHGCAAIMVSGQVDARIAVAAMRGGCCDWLAKDDLTPSTLYHAVMAALEKAALRRDLANVLRRSGLVASELRTLARLLHGLLDPVLDGLMSDERARTTRVLLDDLTRLAQQADY